MFFHFSFIFYPTEQSRDCSIPLKSPEIASLSGFLQKLPLVLLGGSAKLTQLSCQNLNALGDHTENTSSCPTLKCSSRSVVKAFFDSFDSKMVVVLLRLRLPLFGPCISGTAGWRASFNTMLEWLQYPHPFCFLSVKSFQKCGTTLHVEYLIVGYHDVFPASYAQRVAKAIG